MSLQHFSLVALLAVAPLANAETPLSDPVAPAVLGRPLDQIKPVRPLRQKPAAARHAQPKQVAAGNKRVAPARLALAPAAALAVTAVPAASAAPAAQHAPKQALDDRFDPRAQAAPAVGKGTHLASKPLAPGAYLGRKAQAVVQQYYTSHPGPGTAAAWKIGEPVPAKAAVTGVPGEVRAALPRVPPGHQYVQLDGEVVLVAVQSRMVVDGVPRGR